MLSFLNTDISITVLDIVLKCYITVLHTNPKGTGSQMLD